MERLDFTVQSAKALLGVCKKYLKTDANEGISQDDIDLLQTRVDDASMKDTAQKKAVETLGNLTNLQNGIMEKGFGLIRKTQSAAKAAYGEDNKPKMKEFHVGGDSLRTVKAMMSELKYMKSVATDHKDDLAKSGLKDSDIANFDVISAELSDSDTQQENAKKIQKRSTKERDDSLDVLQKAMRRIRNVAKSVFADQAAVLIEFEPVAEGRSAAKKNPPPAPEPASAPPSASEPAKQTK